MASARFYTAPTQGTGTGQDPFRPNALLVGGTGWVGNRGTDGKYLLMTDATVTLTLGIVDDVTGTIGATCDTMGLARADVARWGLNPATVTPAVSVPLTVQAV